MKKIELLAPAGSMDALKAAVAGGCDAVFLGLTSFSARAFAGNFTHEEFIEAVRYCHLRDVKVYVTINTMLFETEIENAIKEVDFLYHHDADALLIQDFGLFHYVRTCYPDFDIHCSTQMHIHNLAGIRQMQNEGAARVVIARETPIGLIREACRTGMDIEVFAYGAICISYSGQCLMSASVKNRSANRGMCAQCCRLKYFHEDGTPFDNGDYLLSPKDLNVIDRLGELIEAGVSSLKIEGRMKRPEYVYLVIRTFREAIDAYYEGRTYRMDPRRSKELLLMFNRGFSHGHLFGDNVKQRMSHFRPNHMGITVGEVIRYSKGRVQVKLSDHLNQNDGLRIINTPEDTGLTAVKIELDGRLVNHASPGDTVWLECHGKPVPKPHQKLQKTSDKKLIEHIDSCVEEGRRSDIRITYEASEGKPFTVTVSDNRGNIVAVHSEFIVSKAKSSPVSEEKISQSLSKTADLPYRAVSVEGTAGNIFIPVSVINETRRQALEKLNEIRSVLHSDRTQARPYDFTLKPKEYGPLRVLAMMRDKMMEPLDNERWMKRSVCPPINPDQDQPVSLNGMILSQAGDLSMDLSHCIGGLNLNIANSYSAAWLLSKQGIDGVVLSWETGNEQIRFLIDAFISRYGFEPPLYKLVYGHLSLMYVKDRFTSENGIEAFSDLHGNIFKVKYNNGMAEIRDTKPFTADNPYCGGSAVLTGDQSENYKEILEEAYEELHERIQGIRTQG